MELTFSESGNAASEMFVNMAISDGSGGGGAAPASGAAAEEPAGPSADPLNKGDIDSGAGTGGGGATPKKKGGFFGRLFGGGRSSSGSSGGGSSPSSSSSSSSSSLRTAKAKAAFTKAGAAAAACLKEQVSAAEKEVAMLQRDTESLTAQMNDEAEMYTAVKESLRSEQPPPHPTGDELRGGALGAAAGAVFFGGFPLAVLGFGVGGVVVKNEKNWVELCDLSTKYSIDPKCEWGTVESAFQTESQKCLPEEGTILRELVEELNSKFLELITDFNEIRRLRGEHFGFTMLETPSIDYFFEKTDDEFNVRQDLLRGKLESAEDRVRSLEMNAQDWKDQMCRIRKGDPEPK